MRWQAEVQAGMLAKLLGEAMGGADGQAARVAPDKLLGQMGVRL